MNITKEEKQKNHLGIWTKRDRYRFTGSADCHYDLSHPRIDRALEKNKKITIPDAVCLC